MVFNSIFFIFCFLPVFMLIYYLVPGKLRNLLLFLGSLIFYAWGEPVYVILMLFSSIFNYYMGTELERLYYDDRKQKINLIFSIIINLAVLVFFKYYGFLLNTIGGIIGIHIPHPELSLPIGLSFYTFRNLSYLFDIYLSKVSAQRNFLTFAVYSTMFPYTSAGPIVRYTDIETQLKQRTINISKFGTGAELFVKGLAKKVLLADNLSVLYSSICGHPQMSVFTSWLGILAYTMQLYFDFSGYSDMAIGLGKMLEFRTMGCLLRTLPFTRKICTSEISEKNTILALHCIHYACSHDRMGILQPDRLWCPWPLPWNYVWDRSFRFHRQNCTLLPQDRIYPSSDQYSYVPSCSLPVL